MYNCKSSINLKSKRNFTKLLKKRRNEDTAKNQDNTQYYRFENKGDSSNCFSSKVKDRHDYYTQNYYYFTP